MIDYSTALDIAQKYIEAENNKYPESGTKFVLMTESTFEFEYGWMFYSNTEKYLKTRNIFDTLPGNAPFIISKIDGSLQTTGTGKPDEYYLNEYRKKIETRIRVDEHRSVTLQGKENEEP